MQRLQVCAGLALLMLGACAHAAPAKPESVFAPAPCPKALEAVASCHAGRDAAGSFVFAAIPKTWNRSLIVFAHGGPRMNPPALEDTVEDLERFAVVVREGYAWVGTTYRREGYAVRRAAEDVEMARAAFTTAFGAPDRTLLHGQSWGAQIALKTLELHGKAADGTLRYDGALLTNGVVAGGAEAYRFRAELRAVWQQVCANHPRPNEAQYPVWMGLPPGARMSRADLEARIAECTGVGLEPAARSAEQRARLSEITAITGIGEAQLRTHLSWATGAMRSLIDSIGGANPFDTREVVYSGSRDDGALNRAIERFTPDPEALAGLDADSKPTGQVAAPVLSVSSLGDQQVSPRLQDSLERTFAAAGRAESLTVLRIDWAEHSRLPDPVVASALTALSAWMETRRRPEPAQIGQACRRLDPSCPTIR